MSHINQKNKRKRKEKKTPSFFYWLFWWVSFHKEFIVWCNVEYVSLSFLVCLFDGDKGNVWFLKWRKTWHASWGWDLNLKPFTLMAKPGLFFLICLFPSCFCCFYVMKRYGCFHFDKSMLKYDEYRTWVMMTIVSWVARNFLSNPNTFLWVRNGVLAFRRRPNEKLNMGYVRVIVVSLWKSKERKIRAFEGKKLESKKFSFSLVLYTK